MNRTAELLEQAAVLLERALRMAPAELTDSELIDQVELVERVGRSVDALRVSAAGEVDARSAYELGDAGLSYRFGHRTGAQLLERLTRASASDVARRVTLGRVTRPRADLSGHVRAPERPAIAAALMESRIGADVALAIHRSLHQAEPARPSEEAVAGAEEELVASAEQNTADYVRAEARIWRDYLDPDGVEPREDLSHENREVRLGRERNGLTPISGALDAEATSLLKAAIAQALAPDAQPRFLDETDRVAGTSTREVADGTIIEELADPRSREQRQHDVLKGLLLAGMRTSGLEPGELRPVVTVMATTTLEELASATGLGWLTDTEEPVSGATIAQLACDSGFRISLLDPQGSPLDEGRRLRLFSAAQRRALAVRDGGCVWPGCGAPASWCQAHHIVPWSRGGETNVENGALLCPAHHRMLHHSDLALRMVDGQPKLLAPPWVDPRHAAAGYRGNRIRRRRRSRSSVPPASPFALAGG
jgi:hypothetical protein